MPRHDAEEPVDGDMAADEALAGATLGLESFEARDVRRVVRKLDLFLLPFLCALFLLNSLDKSNIGNAETAGFTHDAGLVSDDLNVSMAFFFAFFVALQPFGAMMGRYVGMSPWVPLCMSLWGLCTILHVFVHSRTQLVLLRIAVAILEAGFYPTTVHYLSLFYTRDEFAFRLGFFYGQSTVAGAVGALLSWFIFSLYPAHNPALLMRAQLSVYSWQLLFIVEGCLTVAIAVLGFFWLPRHVSSTWFLSTSERKLAATRVLTDRATHNLSVSSVADDDDEEHEHSEDVHEHLLRQQSSADQGKLESAAGSTSPSLTRADVISAFLQYKIWHLLCCNILSAIPATAFAVFLPIVIKEMIATSNPSPALSNLLAAPPFVCGTLTVLIFTRWSDRIQKRIFPILCALILLCMGLLLAVILPDARPVMRYMSICVVLSGSFIASPLTVAWIADNTPSPGKRAVLLGINGWGNVAGVSSAFLFTAEDAANSYVPSFIITLGCALMSFCGYAIFAWLLRVENESRDAVVSKWSKAQTQREALHGNVPLGQRKGWTSQLSGCEVPWLRKDQRDGDERMTYRYTF